MNARMPSGAGLEAHAEDEARATMIGTVSADGHGDVGDHEPEQDRAGAAPA